MKKNPTHEKIGPINYSVKMATSVVLLKFHLREMYQ